MNTKTCTGCNLEKPTSEFYKKTGIWLQPKCKACNKIIGRDYREKNKTKLLLAKKEYYIQNKELIIKKVKVWNKNHPKQRSKYMVFVNAVRRGRKLANGGTFTKVEWNELLTKYDNHCHYCKNKFEKLTIDHYIPLSKGGSNSIENIVPACRSCNASKSDTLPEIWINSKPEYA